MFYRKCLMFIINLRLINVEILGNVNDFLNLYYFSRHYKLGRYII